MCAYTILVADDDELLTDVLDRELRREGYDTIVCHDGAEVLRLARREPIDLILLDVMMPKRNGWEVCRELRSESTIPILMLTARGEEMDRVMGLKLGADDYIIKPFGLLELLARVDANLRRARMASKPEGVEQNASRINLANLTVDLSRRTVTRNGQPVELTQREFDLLAALLAARGAVIERQDMLDQVWGPDWVGDTRTLDVHIRRLRNKLEENDAQPTLILTVRGVGYRLVSPGEIAK